MAAWEENKECNGRFGTGGNSGPQLWQVGGGWSRCGIRRMQATLAQVQQMALGRGWVAPCRVSPLLSPLPGGLAFLIPFQGPSDSLSLHEPPTS